MCGILTVPANVVTFNGLVYIMATICFQIFGVQKLIFDPVSIKYLQRCLSINNSMVAVVNFAGIGRTLPKLYSSAPGLRIPDNADNSS